MTSFSITRRRCVELLRQNAGIYYKKTNFRAVPSGSGMDHSKFRLRSDRRTIYAPPPSAGLEAELVYPRRGSAPLGSGFDRDHGPLDYCGLDAHNKLVGLSLHSPRREFLYSDDAADACVFLMNLPEQAFDSVPSPESSVLSPRRLLLTSVDQHRLRSGLDHQ